jgi:hypothetical protein
MKRMAPISAVMALLMLLFLWGCDNDTSNDIGDGGGGDLTDMTCLGCHSSQEMLEEALAESGSKVEVAIKSDG